MRITGRAACLVNISLIDRQHRSFWLSQTDTSIKMYEHIDWYLLRAEILMLHLAFDPSLQLKDCQCAGFVANGFWHCQWYTYDNLGILILFHE